MENREKEQEVKPQQHGTDEHETDKEVDNTTVNTEETDTDETDTDETDTDEQEPKRRYFPKNTLKEFGIYRSEEWGQNVMASLDRIHKDKNDIIASMVEFLGENGIDYGIIPLVVAKSTEYMDFLWTAERFIFSIGYIVGRHEGETEIESKKSQEKE